MPVELVDEGSNVFPARLEVRSPVSVSDVQSLPATSCVIQYSSRLEDAEHERMGQWFAIHPAADLRVYGAIPASLDFLQHYPMLTGFLVDCASTALTDATGLQYLPDSLQNLSIDIRLPRAADLDTLHRLHDLRTLRLGSIRRIPDSVAGLPVENLSLGDVRTLAGVAALSRVATLRLDSVTADLAPLQGLQNLTDLTLALGGSGDLLPLADVVSLHRFAAWMVRGLSDVTALAQHPGLEEIHLEKLRQVTGLPSFDQASALTTMTLQYMRGLRDLRPLMSAPVLRELNLVEMQHLEVADVAVLRGHRTLTSVGFGLSSHSKNVAARNALGIPGRFGGM